jgi:hypothetical protein
MPALPANVPNKPVSVDASSVRVRDGKIIELANGADVRSSAPSDWFWLCLDLTYSPGRWHRYEWITRTTNRLARNKTLWSDLYSPL